MCCCDILKRKDFPAFVRIGLTHEGQIYGQYPSRRKIRGDKGGRDRRARKRVSRTRTEYRDRYRAAAGNHGVIRPRAFPAIDASWPLVTLSSRACFPCAYIVTLPIPRYSLAKIQSPDFPVEKGPTRFAPGTCTVVYKTK